MGRNKLLTPIIVGAGRRQERANWAGLKRFLEGQSKPEAERDLGRLRR